MQSRQPFTKSDGNGSRSTYAPRCNPRDDPNRSRSDDDLDWRFSKMHLDGNREKSNATRDCLGTRNSGGNRVQQWNSNRAPRVRLNTSNSRDDPNRSRSDEDSDWRFSKTHLNGCREESNATRDCRGARSCGGNIVQQWNTSRAPSVHSNTSDILDTEPLPTEVEESVKWFACTETARSDAITALKQPNRQWMTIGEVRLRREDAARLASQRRQEVLRDEEEREMLRANPFRYLFHPAFRAWLVKWKIPLLLAAANISLLCLFYNLLTYEKKRNH